MSIKNNFPNVRPSLTVDFRNSETVDPRIVTARASTATYTPTYAPDPESTPDEPLPDVIVGWTPNFANIDVIGIIYEPQPDPLPEPPPDPVPYAGWFVNVRVVGEDAEPLMAYSIDPEPYPMRVWG